MLKIRILKEAKETPLNQIQQHNLNFLMNNSEVAADLGELDIYDAEDFVKLVKAIPALGSAKLVKYITGASFGKVFKLDNDHIFKMFSDSIGPDEDYEWYRSASLVLHRGWAKNTTLPVYETGVKKIVGKKVYWVEMAELIPLDKWLEQTSRSDAIHTELSVLIDYAKAETSTKMLDFGKWLFGEIKRNSMRFPDIKKQMYAKLLGKESEAQLTGAEMMAMIRAIKEILDSGLKLRDILPRNIGYVRQSRPDKPVFVIFDN